VAIYNNHTLEMGLPGFPPTCVRPSRNSRLTSYGSPSSLPPVGCRLSVAACRLPLDGAAERLEAEDELRAVALTDYPKEQARRAFGALGGQDPGNGLLEECAPFVSERGRQLEGHGYGPARATSNPGATTSRAGRTNPPSPLRKLRTTRARLFL
jgi:hypothetical protein